jgi:hypothetical protein
MKDRELYSIEDARFLLGGIARKTIYDLLNNGELASVIIGRRRFIPAAAITAFIGTMTTHCALGETRQGCASGRADAPSARAAGPDARPTPHPNSRHACGRFQALIRSPRIDRAAPCSTDTGLGRHNGYQRVPDGIIGARG